MKSQFVSILALGLFISAALAQDKPDLTNHNQKINYALGMDIVQTFKQQEFDMDMSAFTAGMEDSLAGNPAFSEEQKEAAIKELQASLQVKEAARRKIIAAKDLIEGQNFLAANAKNPGIKIKEITSADGSKVGLQYKILKSGPEGPSPQMSDIVEVHYVGSLIDGSVFDSSVKRGIPATFRLTDVIPGWSEALKMMKVGDKWELYIPTKLAYGEFGPPQIPPNSVLIFQLELFSFYTPKVATNVSSAVVN